MNKSFRLLIGLAVSAFFLYFTFRNSHFESLLESVKNINLTWFGLACIAYLIANLFRSVRWNLLLFNGGKSNPLKLFWHLMFGFLINNTFPARAGEFARCYTVSRTFSIPFATVFGSIAIERVSDLFGFFMVMLISLRALPLSQIPFASLGITLAIALCLVLGFILAVLIIKRQSSMHVTGWKVKLISFLDHLTQSIRMMRSPVLLARVIIVSMSVWFMEIIVVYLLSRAFPIHMSISQCAAVITGISFGVMIPASPGYLGTYEAFGTSTMKILGFSHNLASVMVLSLHFLQFMMSVIFGLPILLKFGFPKPKPKNDESPVNTL